MAISIICWSFSWMSLYQEPYYLRSILRPRILANSHSEVSRSAALLAKVSRSRTLLHAACNMPPDVVRVQESQTAAAGRCMGVIMMPARRHGNNNITTGTVSVVSIITMVYILHVMTISSHYCHDYLTTATVVNRTIPRTQINITQ